MLGTPSPKRYRTPLELNYTAQRTLRSVEMISFTPASAPNVAEALGVHARTARRMMLALAAEGYVERGGRGRRKAVWRPTLRLLALAAQLRSRLPVVEHGQAVVAELNAITQLGAALYAPSYLDVLVLASAGTASPPAWTLLPAIESAPGRILLVHRDAWRESQRGAMNTGAWERLEAEAPAIRDAGYAEAPNSLAVPVPTLGAEPPTLALALHRTAGENPVADAVPVLTASAERLVTLLASNA